MLPDGNTYDTRRIKRMTDLDKIMSAMWCIGSDVTASQKGKRVTIESASDGVCLQVHLSALDYTLVLPPTPKRYHSKSVKRIISIDALKLTRLIEAIDILREDCVRKVSTVTVIGQLSLSGHVDDFDYHGVIYPV